MLSVIAIATIYSIVTPIVSVFALAYFLIAEAVYKNNALFVYSAKSESGGILWNNAVKPLIIAGAMFSHLLLASFFLAQGAYGQEAIMLLLIVTDYYFLKRCYHTYEKPSNAAPIGVSTAKDQKEDASLERCGFSNQVYEQPALRLDAVVEEPFRGEVGSVLPSRHAAGPEDGQYEEENGHGTATWAVLQGDGKNTK